MGILNRKSTPAEPVSAHVSSGSNNDVEAGDKSDTVHAETVSAQHSSLGSKWKLSKSGDGDTALALFSDPKEVHQILDPKEEARLQRKIDFMILPYLAVCYAFFYIDKTTLSYAAIFGIQTDLNLVGTQYSWLSSIFYFGFLVWACKYTPMPTIILRHVSHRQC